MTPTPATPPQADRRARAWDLKAEVYAAWHTEPPRARAAALQLQALAAASPDDVELRALADWGDGIAALAEGQLLPALAALERAQAGFVALADAQHAAETQVPQMVALAMSGRDAEAVARGEQALVRFLTVGDQRSAAKVELNLGTMCSRQDRHADAERHFRGAAVRFARAGEVELSIAADGGLAYSLAFHYRFDEGQQVEKGQLLVALDATKLDAQLAEAEANLSLARTSFDRTRQLLDVRNGHRPLIVSRHVMPDPDRDQLHRPPPFHHRDHVAQVLFQVIRWVDGQS